MNEFELIERYFHRPRAHRPDVCLGIGDDAALVNVPAGQELAVAIDTLVAGVHFSLETDPESIGHKALAVNLSDLAAMGAEPAWATLALTLPQADEAWLRAFCRGLFDVADHHGVELIGGDTTHGPLTVTVQVTGLVPAGQALRRRGARAGDQVWVTGTLGDAALALEHRGGNWELSAATAAAVRTRLDRPQPRIAEGRALRDLAHCAIDVSDGLAADLGHLLAAGGVGATVQLDQLPLSAPVRSYVERSGNWRIPLAGGDDYELCFTAAPERHAAIEERFAALGTACTCIGRVEDRPGLRCLAADGTAIDPGAGGYRHFADPAGRDRQ